MHHRVDVRGIVVERPADHPAGLAVWIGPVAVECHAGVEDEVAREPAPDEVKLVATVPDVRPAGGERVFLGDTVVSRIAAGRGTADVAMAVEVSRRRTHRWLGAGERPGRGSQQDQDAKGGAGGSRHACLHPGVKAGW